MTARETPPSRGAIPKAVQDLSDAEFAELDELLAGVPEPLEPFDVVGLDGFLAAVVVQPRIVAPDEWLPYVFDAGGHRWGEAEPGPEQRRARELVVRRQAAIDRSLAERGAFEPFVVDVEPAESDEESEPGRPDDRDPVARALAPWLDGFQAGLDLFEALPGRADDELASELARMRDVVHEPTIDAALDALVDVVGRAHALGEPARYRVDPVRREAPKVGRNDPCPCGSGRKWKQCHGASG